MTWLLLLAALASGDVADSRSRVLLEYRCHSDADRREVTLFGNGTIRVRVGSPGSQELRLAELFPEELADVQRRLREEDLSDAPEAQALGSGELLESCRLILALGEEDEQRYEFARHEALSLPMWRVVQLAEALGSRAEVEPKSHLPMSYRPQPDDLLRRRDGNLFRVIGFTMDGKGVELQGVEQPITIYVAVDDLVLEFEALESGDR